MISDINLEPVGSHSTDPFEEQDNPNELVYKIDPEGKYVIIIDYNDGERELEDASGFVEQLGEWWHSDEPFLVIAPYNGMKVRIERVDSE
jgi:hypothetical protein